MTEKPIDSFFEKMNPNEFQNSFMRWIESVT